MKFNQVKHPSECLMYADSSPPAVFSLWWPKAAISPVNSASNLAVYGNEGVDCTRHKGLGGVGFVDGHAEMRASKTINPKYNPIYNGDTTNSQYWDPMQRRGPTGN
jgi:prepilin-type processing-associated H-X9-DG protein